MHRKLAVLTLILGILTVAFASSSFLHLRQIALSPSPENLLDHFDLRIMAVGMHADSSTEVIDAAGFSRHLQTRVYFLFGVGLVLFLAGGTVLLQPRQSQHEQSTGHQTAGSTVHHE